MPRDRVRACHEAAAARQWRQREAPCFRCTRALCASIGASRARCENLGTPMSGTRCGWGVVGGGSHGCIQETRERVRRVQRAWYPTAVVSRRRVWWLSLVCLTCVPSAASHRLSHHAYASDNALRREEFKRHKAADAKFVAGFLQQWQTYTEQLSQQPPGHFGADLDTTDAKLLNDEQREQLEVLRTEVMSAAAATGDPEGSSGSQPLP